MATGDPSLVERCQAGETDAWSELYDQQHEFVWRTARRLGTPESEIDDVVQDTFATAFKHLRQFKDGKVSTWLFRLVANHVNNRHRSRRVREAFSSLLRSQPMPTAPGPDRAWETKQAQQVVERVLARMAPKKREVFALFELEGLSGEEIAELVGCTVATVWTRLHYAREDFERLARRAGAIE